MNPEPTIPGDDAADEATEAIRHVRPLRISTSGGSSSQDHCDVVVEEALTIMVEAVGSFTVLCTPHEAKALAVGFIFCEGMISDTDDILELTEQRDPLVIAMRVDDPQQVTSSRNLIVTSACGLCGNRNIERLLAGLTASKDSLRVAPSVLRQVAETMRGRQNLFTQTGGTHASAIFSADGEIISFGEDIARHNSLDKAIGRCLLNGQSLERRGVMLSGRIGLELIAKAARAGIEIIGAVSAPSSLAIQAAEKCNITLCGFVRGERATVYTHPHRIEGCAE